VRSVLDKHFAKGSIKKAENGLAVEADMDGPSAKELNRSLLSELRRVEKKTSIRSEWTSENGTIYRFFDYVLKKTFKK
jgi:hypothetical protein